MSEAFDLKAFSRFCNNLRIDTKERGEVVLGKTLLGTQTFVINEIAKGMENGIRDFVTLKCRQIGISTVSLAFDLFWIFKYRALSGALVTHDEPARDQFRVTLDMYYSSLPEEYKQLRLISNRNAMVFANKSRLMFRVAGQKKVGGGGLGRSAALPFLHATEISSWGDPEGLKSLRASLGRKQPEAFLPLGIDRARLQSLRGDVAGSEARDDAKGDLRFLLGQRVLSRAASLGYLESVLGPQGPHDRYRKRLGARGQVPLRCEYRR